MLAILLGVGQSRNNSNANNYIYNNYSPQTEGDKTGLVVSVVQVHRHHGDIFTVGVTVFVFVLCVEGVVKVR